MKGTDLRWWLITDGKRTGREFDKERSFGICEVAVFFLEINLCKGGADCLPG
jgi:hypothetical protein